MSEKAGYGVIAWFYDLLDLPFEYGRYRHIRPVMFAGAGGELLDAGVGTGRNMAYYPPAAKVTGIDLSDAMLVRAGARKARLGIAVNLRRMDVLHTDFAGGRFDFIVATFLFCVLAPDEQLPALRELKRICKPGGEIRILEYCYSQNPLHRLIMRAWAPWVWWLYGAAFDRDTERYVEAAGLELVEQRFLHRDIIKLLVLKPLGS
jgi:ubiquinone/menaquinone biosynthesis C-methylase UbiE